MPKKKVKKPVQKEEPPVMEADEVIEPEKPEAEPGQVPEKKDDGTLLKRLAVGAVFIIALVLAYYFLVLTNYSFATGTPVDDETFKGIFLDADKVYILMDVRGIADPHLSNNVMQCGVDFAASTAFATKAVTPLSIGNEGCVTPNGPTPMEDCFSMLDDGITVYVRGGDGGVEYYNNGMVVYVGQEYAFGTCGIHRS